MFIYHCLGGIYFDLDRDYSFNKNTKCGMKISKLLCLGLNTPVMVCNHPD